MVYKVSNVGYLIQFTVNMLANILLLYSKRRKTPYIKMKKNGFWKKIKLIS